MRSLSDTYITWLSHRGNISEAYALFKQRFDFHDFSAQTRRCCRLYFMILLVLQKYEELERLVLWVTHHYHDFEEEDKYKTLFFEKQGKLVLNGYLFTVFAEQTYTRREECIDKAQQVYRRFISLDQHYQAQELKDCFVFVQSSCLYFMLSHRHWLEDYLDRFSQIW